MHHKTRIVVHPKDFLATARIGCNQSAWYSSKIKNNSKGITHFESSLNPLFFLNTNTPIL